MLNAEGLVPALKEPFERRQKRMTSENPCVGGSIPSRGTTRLKSPAFLPGFLSNPKM